MMKSSPGNSIIVLKAGRQKKIYLVFVSVLFIVMALVLVLSFPGIAKVVVPMFGFLLLIVIVGGLVDTSKGARITLTSSSISGGTLRQKTIPWDKLGGEWIKALRDATSGREREELLEKFSREPPVSLRPLDELSQEERAKADEALQQFKEMTGGEHTRRQRAGFFPSSKSGHPR